MNFNDASLVITPNGTKAGKLYALKGDDLTVTRATTSTRVNASGVIEMVSANVPRLDYSNGTCPSILVEPQRTNILLNSETLATQSVTVTAQPYTLSFYGSGTVALSGTHTASVVGLGTARKTYTFTPNAGTLTLTITGTCTKGQLEAGSFATSYIPTTTAAVTRNADVISKTGISSLIGQTEGTLFLDFNFNYSDSTTQVLLKASQSNDSNSVGIEVQNNVLKAIINSSTSNIANLTNTISTGRIKCAIAYKSNDMVFYVNGVQVGSDTSGSINFGGNVEMLTLGHFNLLGSLYFQSSRPFNSAILWKTRLTNAELAQLTTL